MNLDDAERRLRLAIEEIPSPDRERLLQILTSADAVRAEAIGNLHATGLAPSTVELLIDTEEEPAVRALLVGLLRERQHSD